MPWRLSRRDALRAGVGLATGGVLGSTAATGQRGEAAESFDPAKHGFGFRNWGTNDQYFESPPDLTQATLRDLVRSQWREQALASLDIDTTGLPRGVVEVIARQLHAAVVQRAGTNGHCYGMILSAQAYYADPSSIPVDTSVASEITDPTEPIDSPDAPVYTDIVERQATQYFKFRSWLARRAILRPAWLDQTAVVRDVEAVVDATGTASVILFDDTMTAHQVLVYHVERAGDGVEMHVYDPNWAAQSYTRRTSVITFVREGGELSMVPYGNYTGLLYTRFDQIQQATDRGAVDPLDHVNVTASTIREALFPIAQVVVDSDAVSLSVVDPAEGAPMKRPRGAHMDRTRGPISRIRTQYGATEDAYQIRLLAHGDTEYELRALSVDIDGTAARTSTTRTIDAGAVHQYVFDTTKDGGGALSRRNTQSFDTGVVAAGGVLGGIALGAGGVYATKAYRTSDDPEADVDAGADAR